MDSEEFESLLKKYGKMQIGELMRMTDRYHEAIQWALGCGEDFPTRQPGQGAYWWRSELRKRAGM